MRTVKVNKLRGPNIWKKHPLLEAWIEIGEDEIANSEIPTFMQRLFRWLPTLEGPLQSNEASDQSSPSAPQCAGLWAVEVLTEITIQLQSMVGTKVEFRTVATSTSPNVFKAIIEFGDETVGLKCLDKAIELLSAAIQSGSFNLPAEVESLRDLAHDVCLGPSTGAIVEAARSRQIPWRRLNTGSLVQFGYGAKQRRICTAETGSTSAIAESIAQDKELTRSLLRVVGVPVPRGEVVTSEEEAWEIAQEIGVPVVVKPQYGNHGRGVATNLVTREQVVAAYRAAREEESTIIVEKFAPGDDYRLLVVGGKLVAAARREPANVIGDGESTVEQLVNLVNQDPRRSDGHATSLSRIPLDAVSLAVIQEQGFTLNSIPPAGQKVLIRRNANLSTGGTAMDVTDLVHPDVARQAIDAARVIGLDIAGIDMVALDISQPLHGQHGVVVEVNAGPGLRMHLQPSHGRPRPVGEAIVDMIFPNGENGRIPIVSVTGVNGKTTTTRLVAHILSCTGRHIGMTCTDGIYVDGRRIDTGDCSGPQSARAVLMNPRVDAAVFETARGGMLREGLGFDFCDVGVVTNIGEGDHLGIGDIDTIEKLARVKRIVVENVSPTGAAVLKADDPLVAAMAEHCPGSIVFFAQDGQFPLIVEHRAKGGRVAFVRDHSVVLAEGASEFPLLSLERIPLTYNGKIGFQIENVLAATAACWGLGLPCEQIRVGLESFTTQIDKIPGRFNLLEIKGATVIVDYGHNTSSLQAVLETMQLFPHSRRIAIYSAAGDRRDIDLIRQAELLGDAFDKVVIYEDAYLRGRHPGEIIQLFRDGMAQAKRVRDIVGCQGWNNAVDETLRHIQSGDLVLIQADVVDEAMQYLREFFHRHESENSSQLSLENALKNPKNQSESEKK
jgi:cyanophycin synthetase